jgi:HK97 family phage major capsid protein
MTREQIADKINALLREDATIRERATAEGRGLKPAEMNRITAVFDDVERLEDDLLSARRNEITTRLEESTDVPAKWDPADDGSGNYRGNFGGRVASSGLISRGSRYADMWGASGRSAWAGGFGEFAAAAHTACQTGSNDRRLITNTISEGVPSDGGFSVPSEHAAGIFDVALESEIVRPRATIVPMTSETKKIPATVIGNHSENLSGGVIAYWKGENAALTAATPKLREMELTANKLTVYGLASNEWLADSTIGEPFLQANCSGALSWTFDRDFLKGDGAGKPLGVLKSPSLIAVDAEQAQGANTINYTNLVKMLARLNPASFSNSVWIAHLTALPQLMTLSVVVGTGGSHVPVLTESNGQFRILTRPVVFTEKTVTLGTVGDIMLCDFSQYFVGLRQDMRFETTRAAHFGNDQTDYRCIVRVDGQPAWSNKLTLLDGVTTVSPFVALATRS